MNKKPEEKKTLEAAIAEARAGKTKLFTSGEEFIACLEKNSKKAGKGQRNSTAMSPVANFATPAA